MFFNRRFAAPASDTTGTDELGIFVNYTVRAFGHDRVFSRIKNHCQGNLLSVGHAHLSYPTLKDSDDASTPLLFLRPPRYNVGKQG